MQNLSRKVITEMPHQTKNIALNELTDEIIENVNELSKLEPDQVSHLFFNLILCHEPILILNQPVSLVSDTLCLIIEMRKNNFYHSAHR